MESAVRPSLYENSQIRDVTGDAIRPGGFTLTARALALNYFAPGDRVLDVGCGVGATVEYLIDHHQLSAIGVDPSPVLLECGRQRRPDLPLYAGAGENLPFADGEMDGVFAECTLSLMDTELALAEFCRVLKSGGHLILSDLYARNPDAVTDLRRLPLDSCLTGAMSMPDLEERLQASGFEIVLWEDHSRLLAELTARLILANESLDAFWGKTTCSTGNCQDIQQTVSKTRPGYFFLVARKSI